MAKQSSRAIMEGLRDYCLGGEGAGRLQDAGIGELTKAPTDGPYAAVMLRDRVITGTTLESATEDRSYFIRIYIDAQDGTPEDVEFDIDDISTDLFYSIFQQITFEASAGVRSINPTEMGIQFGYETIQSGWFRIADLVIVVTVDDAATFAGSS